MQIGEVSTCMYKIDSYGISMTKQVTIHNFDSSGMKHCVKQVLVQDL